VLKTAKNTTTQQHPQHSFLVPVRLLFEGMLNKSFHDKIQSPNHPRETLYTVLTAFNTDLVVRTRNITAHSYMRFNFAGGGWVSTNVAGIGKIHFEMVFGETIHAISLPNIRTKPFGKVYSSTHDTVRMHPSINQYGITDQAW